MRVSTYIRVLVLGGLCVAPAGVLVRAQSAPSTANPEAAQAGRTSRPAPTQALRAQCQKEMDLYRQRMDALAQRVRTETERLQKSAAAEEASAEAQWGLAEARQLRSEVRAQMEESSLENRAEQDRLAAEVGRDAAQTVAQAREAAAQAQQLFAQPPGVLNWAGDTGWLGVEISEVTREKAKSLSLPAVRGVMITSVVADSPAATAGLQSHDVILEYDGHLVEGTMQFSRLVRETPPGRTVGITIVRAGHERQLTVEVGHRISGIEGRLREMAPPRAFHFQFSMPDFYLGQTPVLGIEAENVSGQLGAYFRIPGGEGILIEAVNPGTPAAQAGLEAGDVITGVDGHTVKTISDLRSELREKRDQKRVSLTLIRHGAAKSVGVAIESPGSPRPGTMRSAAI